MKRLWTTFRYTFRGLRGQMLGWGLGLGLYGLMIVAMYGMMQAQKEQLEQMIANYPPEFLAFFGGDASTLITPAGFLKMYAFSMMPLIIGIFAVIAGSGLIVSDEERGRLDLIIAHPVGRNAFFFGRSLGMFTAAIAIMLLGWVGFCLLLGGSDLGLRLGSDGSALSVPADADPGHRCAGPAVEHAATLTQPGSHAQRCVAGHQLHGLFAGFHG